MNVRQVFDRVKRHLVAQGRRSVNGYGHLAYKGVGGDMCAVGVLIPDGKYTEELERDPPQFVVRELDVVRDVPRGAHRMLIELAKVHDAVDSWGDNGLSELGVSRLDRVETHFLGA